LAPCPPTACELDVRCRPCKYALEGLVPNVYLPLQVASALMKHAVDKEFEENAPVPENIADLAKAAEEEMKIDAEVMES